MKQILKAIFPFIVTIIMVVAINTEQGQAIDQVFEEPIFLPLVLKEYPPHLSQISFEGREGNENGNDLFVVNEDGSELENISDVSDYDDGHLDWAPNGSKIAFYSTRDGNREIYVMNIDDSEPIRLTYEGDNTKPSWSPDGKNIAFASVRGTSLGVYIVDADGSNITQIVNNISQYMRQLEWSPAGNRIGFITTDDVKRFYIVNTDDGSLEEITFGDNPSHFHWSPDGLKVLFSVEYNNAGRDLFILDLVSREITALTNEGYIGGGIWSPDGRKILYTSGLSDSTFISSSDGSNKSELLCNSESFLASGADWSPDGNMIAYTNSGTDLGLSVVEIDGSNCKRLVDMWNFSPKWRPEK